MGSTPPSRDAGVLLHVTSLPTAYGTGDLGPAAFAWVDRLAKAGVGLWQILPLNLPAGGGAPYSACSAFAGNVYLISPEALHADGLIDDAELKSLRRKPSPRVDFADVRKSRDAILATIAERFANKKVAPALLDAFRAFCKAEASWLEDFALYMALREHHGPDVPWNRWPKRLARRDPAAIDEVRAVVEPILHRRRVEQFLFYRQLDALRAHAKARNVRILGDVPIYVAYDSADVWANPRMFQLDARLEPTAISGVPPDFFSKTGQLWHNPLYDWNVMKRDGFAWWIARMRAMLRQADVVRLDHFRALSAYW
ncbi:4-alpha-glucanotransferase, partial [bacterium]